MALKIVWTTQAEKGLEKVIDYLEKEWSEKEILKFEKQLNNLLTRISKYPKTCPPTKHYKHLRKGSVGKHNYIIYRINFDRGIIELINLRGSKQRPMY